MSQQTPTRKYSSPLRESQAQETRERILRATSDLLNGNAFADISMDDVARSAGVERRTVFRHFATKEALFDAFWVYINQSMNAAVLPTTLEELLRSPLDAFPQFDKNEGIIRASLHTPTGHAMRMRTVKARRIAFRTCLEDANLDVNSKSARKVEALFHLLYSASAWETLKDYGGLTGKDAGQAASWAMQALLKAAETDEN